MKYIRVGDKNKANTLTKGVFDTCGNISVTGSVRGMQKLYGWSRNGQVRCGSWVYNIGPMNLKTLEDANLVH